jgi:Kef-type K+ transport system membrane component KefB
VSIIWLALVSFGADWCGLHFMVGAFLAGVVMEKSWFGADALDQLRDHVLLVMMPVFFLSTGLRTQWSLGGSAVLLVAALLLVASVAGKIAGTRLAGRILRWPRGDATIVGWLLQTKALIEIIFVSVLLDKQIITSEMFTAFLLMAVVSTMLTVPAVTPLLGAMRKRLA